MLETLAKAGHDRKIPIKIAQNEPNGVNANTDYLAKYGKKNHILIFLSRMYMYYKWMFTIHNIFKYISAIYFISWCTSKNFELQEVVWLWNFAHQNVADW